MSNENNFAKYIIVFKELSKIDTKNKIKKLKEKNGIKIKHELFDIIHGCTAAIDDSTMNELLQDPDIEYIEEDKIYTDASILNNINTQEVLSTEVDTSLWHQTMTNTVPLTTDDFSNVNCYVLDSGISPYHIEFMPNQVIMAYNAINKSTNAQDDFGHGTSVASLIGGVTLGTASKTTLHSIKVLDNTGSGQLSDILGGLNWVMANKLSKCILNMSFGGRYSKTLDTAVSKFVKANIPVICAAGNNGTDARTFSPPSTLGVYAVSAHDQLKVKPSWSNYGSVITTFAPGSVIKVADSFANAYKLGNGTSYSSPIVAGIIARYVSSTINITLSDINNYINKSQILNEIINPGSVNTPNKRIVFNQSNIN